MPSSAPLKIVRPRDAATLIPIRLAAGRREVLMGRRAKQHKFLPNVYVFPGGRLDNSDGRLQTLTDLRPLVQRQLVQTGGQAQGRALAIAAVRETWEETGLVLGEIRDKQLVPALDRLEFLLRAITPAHNPIRFHARFFAAEIGSHESQFRSNGELLDLEWRPVNACLTLPLADVTEYVLHNLESLREGAMSARKTPLFSYRNGQFGIS
jgi:8-oxo-dGTP pyrophosphatase MutT (NUDIX family)